MVAVTVVDDDSELLRSRFYLSVHGYARRTTDDVYLHRLVLDAKAGTEVDHVNGDKLDNRRINLRFATRSQQSQNVAKGPYRNVYRHRSGAYYGQIKLNGKRYHTPRSKDREKVRVEVAALRARLLPFASR